MKKKSYPIITSPSILDQVQSEYFDIKDCVYEDRDNVLLAMNREQQINYLLKRDYDISLAYFNDDRSKTNSLTAPTVGSAERRFAEFIERHRSFTVIGQRQIRHFYPKRTDYWYRLEDEERVATHFYYPDILIVDEAAQMIIDIEIDEPYNYKDGSPTHFLNYASKKIADVWCNDEYRDRFFADAGVWVLRFAEEQVIKYPHECLKVIKRLVQYHVANPTVAILENVYDNWAEEIRVDKWTIDQANEMAQSKYRDNYLPLLSVNDNNKPHTEEESKQVKFYLNPNTNIPEATSKLWELTNK